MTFIDCWERATGYDDETSLNGVASYLFGLKHRETEILAVNYMRQVYEAQKMGQWYPSITVGNEHLDQVTATYVPVNGIVFWDMYGKATHTVEDTTQTIVNMTLTEGEKTKKKVFTQWDSSYKVDMFGLVTTSINLEYNKADGLICTQQMMGCKVTNSSATPTTPICPSSQDRAFTNFNSWTWNTVTMDKPISFSLQAQQEILPYQKGAASYYTDMSEHSPIGTGFTVGCMGTTGLSDLWTDRWAGTKRTLTWKMQKANATDYFEVTASNCACRYIKDIRQASQTMGYTASFVAENVSIVVTDNVNDDFYTILT